MKLHGLRIVLLSSVGRTLTALPLQRAKAMVLDGRAEILTRTSIRLFPRLMPLPDPNRASTISHHHYSYKAPIFDEAGCPVGRPWKFKYLPDGPGGDRWAYCLSVTDCRPKAKIS